MSYQNFNTIGTVYLIHFEIPYKHAKHYLGFAVDEERRVKDHQNGQGARLLQVVREAGINTVMARLWVGVPKSFEKQLKRQRMATRLCPVCNPKRWDKLSCFNSKKHDKWKGGR